MAPDVNPSQPTFLGAGADVPPTLPTPTANNESRQVVIRLLALDGTWETCGVDRIPAVVPESVVLDSDDWGNKGARFDLKRDPSQVWPDIGAFTPVKIDVDGSPSWSGRVSETPSRDGTDMVMSVACEGRQHELDDDLVDRFWVHNRVSEWVDTRSFLDAPLGNYKAAGTVSSDRGVFLGWPKGYVISVNDCVGVTLDLGPSRTATEAAVTLAGTTFGAGSFTVYLKGHADLATIISGGTNMASGDPASVTSLDGTSGTAYRYVSVIILCTAGGTLSVDRMVRITDAKVASDTAYLTSGASVLKAPTVIKDVLTRGCPLLSTDQSGVDPGNTVSFNLPAFAPGDPLTSRDAWQAVNAFHGWMSKVDVDGRPVFQAVPSRPKYQIGEWSAAEITDSSQNSGQDIYNRVIVTGQDPAGQPVRVSRTGALVLNGAALPLTPEPITNPSMDTNTTGWTLDAGTSLTRTTTAGEFDTSPGALKITNTGGAIVQARTTLSGTFIGGITYRFSMWAKLVSSTGGTTENVQIAIMEGTTFRILALVAAGGAAIRVTGVWSPVQTITNPVLYVGLNKVGATAQSSSFDSLLTEKVVAGIPDRRNFVRTKQLAVNSVLPSDGVAAAAIGDVWLNNHITTPFRGSVVLTGEDALRNRLTGQPVPLAALLRDTGELLELTDRPDPDTGATTRKGRITTVSYVPALDQATVALDSTRANLDNLLNRLAATG